MKRILSTLLALAMLLSLAACGEKPAAEGEIKEGLCYEATGISPDAAAITVNGAQMPMDIYFYFLTEAAMYMEQFMTYYGMELDWEMPFTETATVAQTVREEAKLNTAQLAVIEAMVKEHNVTLDEATAKEMDEQKAAAMEQVGGEEQYNAIVASMGLRPESYERIRRAQYLQSALQQLYLTEGSSLYVSDEEMLAFAEEVGMMTADHILLGTVDDVTREPLEESVIAERKATAEDLLAQLRAYEGDDLYGYFAELGAEYSTDPGRALNPEGYTFGPGQMVAEFEQGAAALEAGEVSEIIETDYGYHIILRKELDTALALETVRPDYFMTIMQEAVYGAEITENEKLASVDPAAVYEAFLAAQGIVEEAPAEEGEAAPEAEAGESTGESAE